MEYRDREHFQSRAIELMGYSGVSTSTMIRWFADNPTFAMSVAESVGRATDAEMRRIVCRMHVLEVVGVLSHPPGPIMELHVRLIEAGLAVIDWDRVADAIEKGATDVY